MTTEDIYNHQILQPHGFLIQIPEFYLTLTMGLSISVALKACRIGIQQSCVYSSPMHTVEPCIQHREGRGSPAGCCIQQSIYMAVLYTAVSVYSTRKGGVLQPGCHPQRPPRQPPFPSTLPAPVSLPPIHTALLPHSPARFP